MRTGNDYRSAPSAAPRGRILSAPFGAQASGRVSLDAVAQPEEPLAAAPAADRHAADDQPASASETAPTRQASQPSHRRADLPQIVGDSLAVRRVQDLVDTAASSDVTVLLTGETGTGKELAARTIHARSARAAGPFVVVDCAALPEHLQESELFGHRRGAFTDAVADRAGLVAAPEGGVLFIDEISETSPATQARLLRVLQDGQIRRVGDDAWRQTDVRIICATNRRLAELVAASHFRTDLYYRLYVLAIDLPPLRARRGDIPLLVSHLAPAARLEPDALACIQEYDWPGNVRELANQLRSAQAMARGGPVELAHLWPHVRRAPAAQPEPPAASQDTVPCLSAPAALSTLLADHGLTLHDARQAFDRHFLAARLTAAGGSRAQAARSLGVSRSRLYELLTELGLNEA